MTNEQELEYLRSILNTGKYYIVRTDIHGNYTYVNDAYIRSFYPDEKGAIIGRNRSERIALSDQKLLKETLEKCLSHIGNSYIVRLRKVLANHETVINEWEFTAINNIESNIVEIQSIGHNVTQEETQKRVIEKQKNEISHLYSALDIIPVSVIVTDTHSSITYVNKAFTEDTGYSSDDVIGKNPKILASGETLSIEYKRMWEELQKGEVFSGRFINQTHLGKKIFHEIRIAPIYSDKQHVGYVSAQHDITELVHRTEEYERLLDLYEDTCRTASVGGWEHKIVEGTIELTAIAKEIFEIDTDYPIPLMNAGMFYKEGFSRNTLYELSMRAIETENSFDEELEIITAKGKERYVRVTGKTEKRNNIVTRLYGSIIDITEQKKAQQKLYRTMEGLRCLIDNNPHGVFTLNTEGYITSANDTVLSMLQISKEIFIGSHYSVYVLPDDREMINEDFFKALKGERKIQEIGIRHPSLEQKYWRISGIPIMINDTVEGIYVIAEDITDKKHNEEQLLKTQQILDAYFNSTGEVIVISDSEYKIIAFNAQAITESTKIFGGEVYPGKNMAEYAQQTGFKEFNNIYNRVLNGETIELDRHWVIDNYEGWRHISYVPVKNMIDTKSEFLVAFVIRDITDRKKLEISLQERTNLLEKVTTLSPVFITVSEVINGNVIYSGRSMFTELGYNIDDIKEIMSKGFVEGSKILIPYDMNIVQDHIKNSQLLMNGDQTKTQFRMKRKNEDIEWVELRTAIFERDMDGKPTKFINAYLFVTEQVTLSKKLKEINEQLEERVTIRTNHLLNSLDTTNSLIELLSHDVRNKLGGIYLQAEMMQLHAEKIQQIRIQSIGNSIVNLVKEIRDLLDDIIESRRLAENGFNVNKQLINLGEIVTMSLSAVHIQAESKNITIHTEEMTDCLNIDIRLFKELFENFLSNAIKFSPTGKHIYIGSFHKENEIVLFVKDEGPGIQPEEFNKLFTRFGKLSARPTAGEKSTGLGLAITKQIAKVLDCRVWCESTFGEGATFYVAIPLHTP